MASFIPRDFTHNKNACDNLSVNEPTLKKVFVDESSYSEELIMLFNKILHSKTVYMFYYKSW